MQAAGGSSGSGTSGGSAAGGSAAGNGAADGRQARGAGLLAWRWVWAAAVLLLLSTALAWWQDPLPVPAGWAPQKWSFWKPVELNAHRRQVTVPPADSSTLVFEGGRLVSAGNLTGVTFNADGLHGWAAGIGGRHGLVRCPGAAA